MGDFQKHFFIFLIIGLLVSTNVNADENPHISFIRIDSKNGLVNNLVKCLFKDSRGFIWIGTSSGLSRFDGVSFVNYKHKFSDSTSIIDNYIESIQEDDKGTLWIKTRWDYTIFDFEKNTFSNSISDTLKQKGINGELHTIYIDKKKKIWYKPNESRRFLYYDYNTKKLIDPFSKSKYKNRIIDNLLHEGNRYYCLYDNGIIECFDDTNFNTIYSNDYLLDKIEKEIFYGKLFVDSEGDLWVYGQVDGIFHYQVAAKKWSHYDTESKEIKLSSNIISKIIQDDKGLIWIGTDHGGINIINKFSKKNQVIYNQKDIDKSLPQNSITDLILDNNNVVWVGTYKRGISYYHESIHKFPHIQSVISDKNSLPFNDVNCFVEDKKGNLWIGTNGYGLMYFNRQKNTYKVYQHELNNRNSLCNDVVVSLFIDDEGLLWIGTYMGGLNSFDGKIFKHYRREDGLLNDNVWSITQDRKKRIWIGTLGSGIVLFNKQTNSFQEVVNNNPNIKPSSFISRLHKMKNGNMFIATAEGIIFYDIEESRYRYHPTKNINIPITLPNNNVNDVYEDSRGLLWIATREGLSVLDPYSSYSKMFITEDGLAESLICCILEDEYQSIWVSKSNGLSQITVNAKKPDENYNFSIYNYTQADGLQDQEYNVNASLKTSKGELIFGGLNGFNIFQTKNLKFNKTLPEVVFTDFKIFNQTIQVGEKMFDKVILNKPIFLTEKVTIEHSMNVFSIYFAALNTFVSEKVKFKYLLEGFDKDWRVIEGEKPAASYTNIDPGTYIFKVKACNNDGVWNDNFSQIKIEVLPPFYASPLAFIIYSLLVIGVILFSVKIIMKRTRFKFEIEQERIQTKRNKEMDEMKLHFLTNVSHEFRTPLTLILTPIEKLKKLEEDKSKIKLLDTVNRNAQSLLELVNQLLDFRKLDLHGLKYTPSYGNISRFLSNLCDNFKDSFIKKGIELKFKSKLEDFYFEFDKEKLQKVMMNLISNSLKFTPSGGEVRVKLKKSTLGENENIIIQVKDTGVGIKEEEKEKIFERFYQSKNNISLGVSGSGIGLNLAKEMVILHGGTITVESEPGHGAEFTISIPIATEKKIQHETVETNNETSSIPVITTASSKSNGKLTVLLIEDNADFREFMKDSLNELYKVHEAQNGVEGFEIIHKIIPDIIISDVMMPRMDGLELCRKLKGDLRTSHIPLILLTARTADEDKIKGLEIGADDYITKPFNMDLLLLRIQNLVEKRKKIQSQFQKNVTIEASEVEIPSAEEKLIKKAIAFVEKNIDEPKFSVEDLSSELAMSRVYLYKKLLAITGKTPVEFIRIIRLKRGAQLLEKSKMNIAEVAYSVGFNSPRYFSKYFKDEYGMLPKDYIKKFGNKEDDKIDI